MMYNCILVIGILIIYFLVRTGLFGRNLEIILYNSKQLEYVHVSRYEYLSYTYINYINDYGIFFKHTYSYDDSFHIYSIFPTDILLLDLNPSKQDNLKFDNGWCIWDWFEYEKTYNIHQNRQIFKMLEFQCHCNNMIESTTTEYGTDYDTDEFGDDLDNDINYELDNDISDVSNKVKTE